MAVLITLVQLVSLINNSSPGLLISVSVPSSDFVTSSFFKSLEFRPTGEIF